MEGGRKVPCLPREQGVGARQCPGLSGRQAHSVAGRQHQHTATQTGPVGQAAGTAPSLGWLARPEGHPCPGPLTCSVSPPWQEVPEGGMKVRILSRETLGYGGLSAVKVLMCGRPEGRRRDGEGPWCWLQGQKGRGDKWEGCRGPSLELPQQTARRLWHLSSQPNSHG